MEFDAAFKQKFWAMVDKTDSCWLWNHNLYQGYGRVWLKPRTHNAHRVSYILSGRTIPAGTELDHLCRVRNCVNPDHLEPVSHAENIKRGIPGQLKDVCKRGHPLIEGNVSTFVRPNGRIYRQCKICTSRGHSIRYFKRKLEGKT